MIRHAKLALYSLRIKSRLELFPYSCRLRDRSLPIRLYNRDTRSFKFSSDNIRKKTSSKSTAQLPYKKTPSSPVPNPSDVCPEDPEDSSKIIAATESCSEVTSKCPPPLLSKDATPLRINKALGIPCDESKCEVKEVCPLDPCLQDVQSVLQECSSPHTDVIKQHCELETLPKSAEECKHLVECTAASSASTDKKSEVPLCPHEEPIKPSPPPPPPPPPCPPPQTPPASDGTGGGQKWLLALLAAAAFGGAAWYFFLTGERDRKKESATGRGGKKKNRLAHELIKIPATSQDLPKQVQYLMVGGGTAAFSAFRSIKSIDPRAQVLVISKEPEFPYMRPPLSKELWNSDQEMSDKMNFRQWNGSVRSIFYEPDSFYMDTKALAGSSKGGVAVARGWTVTCIDPVAKQVVLDDGTCISYDKCLLAPGSIPKRLPVLDETPEVRERVFYYRNIFDYRDLAKDVQMEGQDVVVVGGGLLGCELACSLSRRNNSVTQIFREGGLLAKLLPQYLSKWLGLQIAADGVTLVCGAEVIAARAICDGRRLELTLSNGNKVSCDSCVVAIGAEPDTSLAEPSKLETDPKLGGYLVNPEMQARSNLYVAGDAACFFDERFGRRRIEHHDHAVVSGRLAGENMAGAGKPYLHQSMLWSDLSPDVGWEGVGILDPSLRTVGIFALNEEAKVEKAVDPAESTEEPSPQSPPPQTKTARTEDFSKGVVFYLNTDGIIIGILLWNVFNRMQLARQILKHGNKYEDLNEVAKLFSIHEN